MFVRIVAGRPGIGKVIASFGAAALVEYFRPFDVPVREEHPVQMFRQVSLLPAGTIVYFEDDAGRWQIGQVSSRVTRGDQPYIVACAGRESCVLNEDALHIPLADAPADRMQMLRGRTFTSAVLHDYRHQFLRYLMGMRDAAAGMSGLVSSRIELLPHQIEVVRRVLSDPIQRYLLADEVGLGKTIEAGIILRQYLLDNPRGRALVIAPKFLLEQWRWELLIRFTLGDLGAERVTRLDPNELSRHHEAERWGMLIVDEAHHIAGQAFSLEETTRAQYTRLSHIAHRTRRVLLLSATPVLHHERDFLGMLHLLDDRVYKLNELDQFEKRVRNRQRVGRLLLMLTEGSEPDFVRMHLAELNELANEFRHDQTLQHLVQQMDSLLSGSRPLQAAEEAESAVANAALRSEDSHVHQHRDRDADGDEDVARNKPVDLRAVQERLDEIVRALRAHIGETYRLHRRLLRTRRDTLDRELLPPRLGPENGDGLSAAGVADEDLRLAEAERLVEMWRDAAADAAMRSPPSARVLRAVYVALAQAVPEPELLACMANARRFRRNSKRLGQVFGAAAAAGLVAAVSIDGEEDLLKAMEELARTSAGIDRVAQLCRLVAQGSGEASRFPKTVVFATDADACIRLVTALRAAFGEAVIASHVLIEGVLLAEMEHDVKRFVDNDDCRVIVCDRSGEEGRNLQVAKRIVHYDLPWSPNRIEQRMGRLDRIGQGQSVEAIVFSGIESGAAITRAWCRMMTEAFGVFGGSIAGLQFLIDRTVPELMEVAFREGPDGLANQIDSMRTRIAEEQRQNEEQYAVDEMVGSGISGHDYIRKLDAHESRPDQIQTAVERWACDGLGLTRETVDAVAGVVKYVSKGATLIPADHAQEFQKVLNTRGTYERAIATRMRNVRLFRLGEPFIEALARLPDSDDRGRTFGLWRQKRDWDGPEWTGFRFCFRVTANVSTKDGLRLPAHVEQMKDAAGLRRQVESFFAPMLRTVFVTTDGLAETDERVLCHLRRDATDSDFCLGAAPAEILGAIIDPSIWPTVCDRCLVAAERSIRVLEAFVAVCADRRCAAQAALDERLARLRVRYDLEVKLGLAASLSQDDLDAEREYSTGILGGMTNPTFALDSVGFIVLSKEPPPGL